MTREYKLVEKTGRVIGRLKPEAGIDRPTLRMSVAKNITLVAVDRKKAARKPKRETCLICGKKLTGHQRVYCSQKCSPNY